jgi:2'-5' RNA ligase
MAMRYNQAPKDSQSEVIRTFICIDVSPSIKSRLAALQDELRKLDASVSWVKPANIHLTLKFLGDAPVAKLPQVIEAVRRVCDAASRFEVEASGAGCFPSPRKPNVLWVGLVHLPEALLSLQRKLEEALEAEGFARETKPFKPHLTIGRIRQPRNAQFVAAELLKGGFATECFPADEVIVMRSNLTPRGALYTPLATILLSGA